MNRFIVLICFTSLLVGCSSKLAYNNLDWVGYWYLTDYIEFSDEQESDVKAQLVEVLEWHRVNELPKYRTELQSIQLLVEQGQVEKIDWNAVIEFVRFGWYRLRDQFVDRTILLLPSLKEEQVDELFEVLTINNQKKIAEIRVEPDERLVQRYEQLAERLEGFIGELTDEQRLLVELNIGASFDTRIQYLESNKLMQAEVKRLISDYLENPSPSQLSNIQQVLKAPEQYRPKQLDAYSQENRALALSLFRDLAATLTEEQRLHLLRKVSDWIHLIDSLTKNKKSLPK